MCSPQALLGLQVAKALTTQISANQQAGAATRTAGGNIEELTRAFTQNIQDIVEEQREARSEIVAGLDQVIARVKVATVESGFAGKLTARLKKAAAATAQKDLSALRRQKDRAISNANIAFSKSVGEQNNIIARADAFKKQQTLNTLLQIGVAGANFGLREKSRAGEDKDLPRLLKIDPPPESADPTPTEIPLARSEPTPIRRITLPVPVKAPTQPGGFRRNLSVQVVSPIQRNSPSFAESFNLNR